MGHVWDLEAGSGHHLKARTLERGGVKARLGICQDALTQSFSLYHSPAPHLRQSATRAELGWLPQLPLLEGRRYLQPNLPPRLPRYDSALEPLLHQLLSQHLPSGGPDLWPEQRRGIYTV